MWNVKFGLVLGSTLSKTALEKSLSKAKPVAEAIQATHLLQSTLASIGGSNARFQDSMQPLMGQQNSYLVLVGSCAKTLSEPQHDAT